MNQNIPFDAYLWLVAGALLTGLAYSGIRNYRKTKSKVSLYSGIAWALIATGLYLWSVPLLFTQNDRIITNFIFAGTVMYTLTFLMQCFNMWYILFRTKVPVWLIMIPATAVWVITQYLDTKALLTNKNYVAFTDAGLELQQLPPIFSLLSISLFTIGFYFIKIAHSIDKGYARLRAYLLGFIYILFASYQVFTAMTSETTGSLNTGRNIFIVTSIIVISLTFALSSFKPNPGNNN